MTRDFPPEFMAKMDLVEGTARVGYDLPEPVGSPPPELVTLAAGMTPSGSLVHIDVDPEMHLHWVRRAPAGGQVAAVDVDLSPLRGAVRLNIFMSWSPFGLAVRVEDRDSDRMVSSEPEDE